MAPMTVSSHRNTRFGENGPGAVLFMRVLILVGSFLLLLGSFVFTRGGSWAYGYMISGGFIGLAGLAALGLAAAAATAPAASGVKPVRSRRRSITARPGKMRRIPVSVSN